jgi:hypothetical protein
VGGPYKKRGRGDQARALGMEAGRGVEWTGARKERSRQEQQGNKEK